MRRRLRPIDEQVMVITGADSGIGLATAREAAERGAKVVLSSRNPEALAQIVDEIEREGGEAAFFACDVADINGVLQLAETAVRQFGRIDTWVNNAGVSIYGEIERVPLEDARRLFETNYWGVVNGSLAAVPYLRATGGALINVGSVVSDRAVPLQGHYSASKHAVKAFTDALRMELEKEGAPVVVTLVKPASIDTPYTRHAENLLDDGVPDLPAPVYAPEVVANVIIECAEHPIRNVTVGGGGRALAVMGNVAPRLADRQMRAMMFREQRRDSPGALPQENTLWTPSEFTGHMHGDYDGHVAHSSAYTGGSLNKGKLLLALSAVGLGWFLVRNGGMMPGRRGELGTIEVDLEERTRTPGYTATGAGIEEVAYAHGATGTVSGGYTRTASETIPPGTAVSGSTVEVIGPSGTTTRYSGG
ncbi:MAG TPA: SDR family oxidoreductase [Longimicrobium sp.]|nr:SDR family oxidoreductase [Longimicrobium sp.]